MSINTTFRALKTTMWSGPNNLLIGFDNIDLFLNNYAQLFWLQYNFYGDINGFNQCNKINKGRFWRLPEIST